MWKRDNETPAAPPPPAHPAAVPATPPVRRDLDSTRSPRSPQAAASRAVIGAATLVRGELSGDEDLVIEGRFEGRIELPRNSVTVATSGHVAAEVRAASIVVEGEVQGNLMAAEEVVLRRSGRVHGDLQAPRVTIEDGARFKGSIDMEADAPALPVERAAPTPEAGGGEDTVAGSLAYVGGGDS